MHMPHLSIHSVQGRIGIHSKQAKIDVHMGKTEMSIQQPKAELSIKRTPSKLSIDQSQAWNNLNLKSAVVRIRDAANAGRQAVMEGIARRVQQGDALMKIENKGTPIISQAVENSQYRGGYDTGHVPPFEAVKIQYQPSRLEVNWKTRQPIIEAMPIPPKVTYDPGNVNVYMQQYPSVSIQVDTSA